MSKTILITGAATRIGRVLTKGLANNGWTVAIHYNSSQKQAQTLAKDIILSGGQAVTLQADLTEPSQTEVLIVQAAQKLGRPLDALVNNASVYLPDDAREFTAEQLNTHMAVNLTAPLMLSKVFAAHLPKSRKGCILNMIDQRVLRPTPDFFTYTLSKQALYAATKTLAQALAPAIRVNAIGPGPTLKSTYQTEGEFTREVEATLLETGSPPDSILQAALYLLSAQAVTGQMIAVDGGQHLEF